MERIRAFEVTNKTTITTLVHIQTDSGVVIKSDNIPAGQSIVIDLNNYLSKIKDGDTVFLVPQLGRGTTKKSQEFIYRAGALDKAIFEISRTRIQYKLKFIEIKEAYDSHVFYEEDNVHEINGINYALLPEESIAIVHPKSEGEYKGAVKIPSTITYQRKKYVVTEIGKFAFLYNEELTSLTIPASICFINDFVIKDCSNLTKIRVESDTPAYVEPHGFQEFRTKNCTLYVPLGSVEIYRNTFHWDKFENIQAYWNRGIFDEINRKMAEFAKAQKLKGKLRRKNPKLPKE